MFAEEVAQELVRARCKFPNQENNVDLYNWLAIVVEEIGEIAREMNEFALGNTTRVEHNTNMRYELVQVAAMVCRMAVALECQTEEHDPPSYLLDNMRLNLMGVEF